MTNDVKPASPTAAFLELLFGNAPAGTFLSLWCMPAKESIHLPADDLAWAAENVRMADVTNGQDVYFGLGLRKQDLGPHRRGAKGDVVALTALWVDVDVQGPGHAAANLPPTFSDAVDLLDAVPAEPTAVVDSGGGLHAYWILDTPFVVTSAATRKWFEGLVARLQSRVQAAAGTRGWHVDATADCTRVLRAAGTSNRKIAGTPTACYTVDQGGSKHSVDQLAAALGYTARPGTGKAAPAAPSVAAGTPPAALPPDAEIQRRLRERLRTVRKVEHRELIRRVLAGDAFAAPGERDSVLQRVASIIAFVDPVSPPEVLVEVLRCSLEQMEGESDGAPTLDDATDKIRRAQIDANQIKAEEASKNKAMADAIQREARSRHAASNGPGVAPDTGPYSEEELDSFAAAQRCSREALDKRWVIQKGTAFFVLGPGGVYKTPLTRDELAVALPHDLALAPVSFVTQRADGGMRKKKIEEVLADHCTVARGLITDLALDRSYFDPATETFHEAACPLRHIAPAHDPVIQEWLERMGGSEREKLLDWVATITLLDKQSAALYLSGPPGTGKTLLVSGLARLWTQGGPSELAQVLANFNSCLTECPLVFADEHLPSGFRGQRTSAELRQLIGSNDRALSRKYLPTSIIKGCIRLVLAANNERMLAFNEDMGAHDLAAVSERFLHVDTVRAAGFLAKLGGRAATEHWVDQDLIAAHALWLRDNRKVAPTPDGRFVVQGTATRVHRQLATQGRSAELVVEWLARFLDANQAQKNFVLVNKQALLGNGELLVNTLAITDTWDAFIKSSKLLSTAAIGRALANLSKEQRRVGASRFHVINVDLVYDWAEANQVGDTDAMRRAVNTPLPAGSALVPAAAPAALPNGFPASAAAVFGIKP